MAAALTAAVVGGMVMFTLQTKVWEGGAGGKREVSARLRGPQPSHMAQFYPLLSSGIYLTDL